VDTLDSLVRVVGEEPNWLVSRSDYTPSKPVPPYRPKDNLSECLMTARTGRTPLVRLSCREFGFVSF
jgi:hypothetical protein